jgi:hypothetical protein|tara:strand:+ start:3262 stop:3453 length:192 start_codon:yes stop_codon:yes gene_type:complete
LSTFTAVGKLISASRAGPPSPEKPASPFPNTVVILHWRAFSFSPKVREVIVTRTKIKKNYIAI